MATQSADDAGNAALTQALPQAPYGVVNWAFVTATQQASFVKTDEFSCSTHFLPRPVVLGLTPDPQLPLDPVIAEHQDEVDVIEDADGEHIATAHVQRYPDGAWAAVLRNRRGGEIGKASGTAGSRTSASVIHYSLVALVRHIRLKNDDPW